MVFVLVHIGKKSKGYPYKMSNFEAYCHQFDGKKLSNAKRYIVLCIYPNFMVRMPGEMGLLDGQTLCIICQ